MLNAVDGGQLTALLSIIWLHRAFHSFACFCVFSVFLLVFLCLFSTTVFVLFSSMSFQSSCKAAKFSINKFYLQLKSKQVRSVHTGYISATPVWRYASLRDVVRSRLPVAQMIKSLGVIVENRLRFDTHANVTVSSCMCHTRALRHSVCQVDRLRHRDLQTWLLQLAAAVLYASKTTNDKAARRECWHAR